MTEGTLGVRRPRSLGMASPKAGSMVEGPFCQRVITRSSPRGDLGVANRAVAYAEVAASSSRLVAHRAVPHRRHAQLRDRSLFLDTCVTSLARNACVAAVGEMLCVRELQVLPVQSVA